MATPWSDQLAGGLVVLLGCIEVVKTKRIDSEETVCSRVPGRWMSRVGWAIENGHTNGLPSDGS